MQTQSALFLSEQRRFSHIQAAELRGKEKFEIVSLSTMEVDLMNVMSQR